MWHLWLRKFYSDFTWTVKFYFSFICLNKTKVNISTVPQGNNTSQPNFHLYSCSSTHWLFPKMCFYNNKFVLFIVYPSATNLSTVTRSSLSKGQTEGFSSAVVGIHPGRSDHFSKKPIKTRRSISGIKYPGKEKPLPIAKTPSSYVLLKL